MAKARPIPGLRPEDPYREAAAKVVAVRAQEVFDHAGGVLDTDDIERVHAMRVATRRLRAVLEIFASCFPKDDHRAVLADVKRLADALGERRDPDVQLVALRSFAGGMPARDRRGIRGLLERLEDEQQRGNVALADALERVETTNLRERIELLVEAARA